MFIMKWRKIELFRVKIRQKRSSKSCIGRIFFTVGIFILAILVQRKIDLELSQLERMDVPLASFCLFELPPLQVLGECCFKSTKVPLDKHFYHLKGNLWAISISNGERGTFSVFMDLASLLLVLGEKILLDEVFGKIWNITFCKYFVCLEFFELNIELEAICRKYT